MFGIWLAVIGYALQIYYDFSGYSDMAIGLGRIMGFHYLENFNDPYAAVSITDFWRRWHISLSTFFRDYVYIPLGGNRVSRGRWVFNLAVVWILTGLWHGASWNFVIWGVYFGILLVIEKTFLLKLFEKLPKFIGHIYLLFAVIFGWAIFYFTDLTQLSACVGAMFGGGGLALTDILTVSKLQNNLWLIIIALVLCAPVYGYVSKVGERFSMQSGGNFIFVSIIKTVFLALVMFLSVISLVGDTYNPFLYFRF